MRKCPAIQSSIAPTDSLSYPAFLGPKLCRKVNTKICNERKKKMIDREYLLCVVDFWVVRLCCPAKLLEYRYWYGRLLLLLVQLFIFVCYNNVFCSIHNKISTVAWCILIVLFCWNSHRLLVQANEYTKMGKCMQRRKEKITKTLQHGRWQRGCMEITERNSNQINSTFFSILFMGKKPDEEFSFFMT